MQWPRDNAHLLVLISDDDKTWRQVFQNPGIVFYGCSDKKPLEVKLSGIKARYVRLQLPGKSYFHLDEVEIYPLGESRNAAWAGRRRKAASAPGRRSMAAARRGRPHIPR